MKNLIPTFTRIFAAAALLMTVSATNASDIELRFNTARVDLNKQELYVDVQVHYDQSGQVILAGQNYRFYYDSEVLSLDVNEAKSKLPTNTYGELSFEKHLSGVQADEVNQLGFDDHLGFANFSIDLSDHRNGGIALTSNDNWVSVATLKFNILKKNERYDIVWGRNGVSDLYATAFVEMAQWMTPTQMNRLNITYYGDLISEPSSSLATSDVSIKVGPNPTSDFINITFNKELDTETTVTMTNAIGQQVKRIVIKAGSINTKINVADLAGSNYFIEISDTSKNLNFSKQVVVAK